MNVEYLEKLMAALKGVDVTEKETRILAWLAGWDAATVEVFVGLFEKCRGGAEK